VPRKAVRLSVLLLLLAVVALWAVGRTRERRARTTWQRPVAVAVLVLGDATPVAMGALRRTLDALGQRLDAERARLAPAAPGAASAFTFEVLGPLRPARLPPTDPPGPSPLDRAGHALEVWRGARAAHAEAPGFDPDTVDVRVYLVVAPGGGRFAEGLGEAGGEVGIVRADLSGDPLLAATAVVHETLHTLGATDKYDAAGHAVEPGGLAEPARSPRFPQRLAEIMVGEVPLAPGAGRLPSSPAELGLGPVTAGEIGWLEPAP
jgi:hypothetical protein